MTDTDPRVELIFECLSYPPIYPERAAALTALAALAVEKSTLRDALEIIAEHSADDGARQLAVAALDYDAVQASVRAEAS